MALQSESNAIRDGAQAILDDAMRSDDPDKMRFAMLTLLSSDDKQQRKNASITLMKLADDRQTVAEILFFLKENRFGSEVDARFIALRVLAKSRLDVWADEDLRNDARKILEDLLEDGNYCSGREGDCIWPMGPGSQRVARRALIINVVAAIDTETNAAKRRRLREDLIDLAADEPTIVVEEIVDSLKAKKGKINPVSRDILLGYLVDEKHKPDKAAWRGAKNRDLVREMVSFLDQDTKYMGPQARAKAKELRSILRSYR